MKRFFSLLLSLSVCLTLMAQYPPASNRQADYPFIRFDLNTLHFDSTSPTMQHLLYKWAEINATAQGNLSILHIGGSHVQAGTLPHRVRTRLLTAYPNLVGGRGLLFPYSAAARCNNPDDYKVHCVEKVTLTRNVFKELDCPLGLCGIAVTAHDVPTTIQLIDAEPLFNYSVSRIILLGYSPQGLLPRISYDGFPVLPSYIDSANHRFVFNLTNPVDSFDIHLPCKPGQSFTLTGVALSSRHHGISYHSVGVNGAAVPDYLKCNLSNDLRLIHPDLVIFGIGINDAHGKDFDSVAFKNNYLALCDSIRNINPNCAFIFITNNDCYFHTGRKRYTVNPNGLQVRDVCYRLASITGGAVWDQFEIMGGLKSMAKWQKACLARTDKVHFTRAGYQLLGDLLFEALDQQLQAACLKWSSSYFAKQQAMINKRNSQQLPRGLRRKTSHPRQ